MNIPLHVAEDNLDYALWPPAGMKRKGHVLPPATLGPPAPLVKAADDDLGFEDEEEEAAPAAPAAAAAKNEDEETEDEEEACGDQSENSFASWTNSPSGASARYSFQCGRASLDRPSFSSVTAK